MVVLYSPLILSEKIFIIIQWIIKWNNVTHYSFTCIRFVYLRMLCFGLDWTRNKKKIVDDCDLTLSQFENNIEFYQFQTDFNDSNSVGYLDLYLSFWVGQWTLFFSQQKRIWWKSNT